MKHDLPCAVVRDLMPSYIEGLTEPETTGAVTDHLAGCDACRSLCESMRAPQPVPDAAENAKEVDYLKAVRRKNRRRILLAALGTALVLIGALLCQVFVIGTAVPDGRMDASAELADGNGDGIVGDALVIRAMNPGSAKGYTGWKTVISDGVAEITAREVLVSALNRNGLANRQISLDGLHEVRVFGVTVWQDGTVIHPAVMRMYEARTPYMGSMWKLNLVDQTVQLPEASFTNELFTDKEPYARALYFERTLTPEENAQMRRAAARMLALVDNLSEVRWTWPAEGGTESASLNVDDVNALLGDMLEAHAKLDTPVSECLICHSGDMLTAHTQLDPAPVPGGASSVKQFGQSPAALQLFDALLHEDTFRFGTQNP